MSFHSGWTNTVKALIVANGLAFLGVLLLRKPYPEIYQWVGLCPANFLHGAVWQPVTYMFVHGGLLHLIVNMVGLVFFAGDVERSMGRWSFLVMYFLCGVGGAALSLFQPEATVIGASGGVLGVLVAFALLFPDARVMVFLFIPVRARYLAIFYGFITIASLLADTGGSVANWAHLGGIVVAVLYVKARPLARRIAGLFGAARGRLREHRSAAEQAELDRILDKVHHGGITTLTNQERDFLNTISRKYRDRK